MKKTIRTIALFLVLSATLQAQLTMPPPGGNKKATVGERIGITDVTINYDRPGVKGREGKIFGALVYEGYSDLAAEGGTSAKAPWRAGANENTTISFSTDVKIEGKDLAAGKYGFFVAYGPKECTLIFSKDNASWGSYFYDEKNDALRVNVKTGSNDKSVEWLKFEFTNETENAATIELQWEKTVIPFKVEVDLVKTELASFRTTLKGAKGFDGDAFSQAAAFCLRNNTNLEEASAWADRAVLFKKDFQTLSTKAMLLEKSGKGTEADALMKEALTMGSMIDLHQYGRQQIGMKKNKAALETFQLNFKKNPKQFTTYVGLARGYSANGDYKNALVNAKAALPLAPDALNKGSVEGMIKKLEEGKDIN